MAHPDPRDVSSATAAAAPTFQTALDSRAAFHAALLEALTKAQREVWLADRDFADWPLDSAPFASALQAFLRGSPANHLKLLTRDVEHIASGAPRFLRVLKPHATNAQCRTVPPHAAARFGEACSMMIVDRSLLVRRFHRDHPRGSTAFDPAAARPWLDQFETVWRSPHRRWPRRRSGSADRSCAPQRRDTQTLATTREMSRSRELGPVIHIRARMRRPVLYNRGLCESRGSRIYPRNSPRAASQDGPCRLESQPSFILIERSRRLHVVGVIKA